MEEDSIILSMGNCISVEKFVQNLRTTENNQVPISPAGEAKTYRDGKFYLSTDSLSAMIPNGERDTLSYSPIIVPIRQEPRYLTKGYICAYPGRSCFKKAPLPLPYR